MTSDRSTRRPWSILVINPNTTQAMTDALIPLIEGLNFDPILTKFTFFTAPSGVPSINNEADAKESARHCLPTLITNHLANHDAFLICCYSAHPLS
ncbi:hydantoin racemase (Dcg1) like protein [Acrodontium crateriforme]|uniref:Hydantoin racemase (Dcg1) like protein n=1 Tax=Acrodontium crateriforme TaxID=150365 RepID=A0AAQ3M1K5_9PEZI|nr:hydantoin racemase (Dcg1) like protein [Acrodontium crateriforme]